MKRLMLILTMMLSLCAVDALAAAPPVTYTWTAPTVGSPVVRYIVQLRSNSGPWVEVSSSTTSPTYTFSTFDYLSTYEVRVAGVDAMNRQGLLSDSSIPYMPDQGIPGAPGKPVVVTIP